MRSQRQHREALVHIAIVIEESGQMPTHPEQGNDEGGGQSAHVALQLGQGIATPATLFSDPSGEYPKNPADPSQVRQVGYGPEQAQVWRWVSHTKNNYACCNGSPQ